MRTMLKVRFSAEAGNRVIADGTLPKLVEKFVKKYKPEAAYFTTDGGKRTGFIVADIKDPHQMVSIAEPWFLALNAGVEYYPAMTPEDLQRAGPDMERAAKTYG